MAGAEVGSSRSGSNRLLIPAPPKPVRNMAATTKHLLCTRLSNLAKFL